MGVCVGRTKTPRPLKSVLLAFKRRDSALTKKRSLGGDWRRGVSAIESGWCCIHLQQSPLGTGGA